MSFLKRIILNIVVLLQQQICSTERQIAGEVTDINKRLNRIYQIRRNLIIFPKFESSYKILSAADNIITIQLLSLFKFLYIDNELIPNRRKRYWKFYTGLTRWFLALIDMHENLRILICIHIDTRIFV